MTEKEADREKKKDEKRKRKDEKKRKRETPESAEHPPSLPDSPAKKTKTDTEKEQPSKAHPVSSPKVSKMLYELIEVALNNKLLKRGANEVIKSLDKGKAEIVILAADTQPFAIIEPVVGLCEDKNVNYFFTPSLSSLGKACGVERPVTACCVLYSEQSFIKKMVNEIRNAR